MGKKDKKRQQHLERERRRKESKKRSSKGKKARAERKQALRASRPEPTVMAFEYYYPAFAHILRVIEQQGYSAGPSPKRRSFWQLIPPGRYLPDKATEYLEAYLQSLETALRDALEQNSLAYWHHVYRRFAPTSIGEDTNPTTVQITRAVLDAAIQKYAKTEFCNRIAPSDQVDPAKILKGLLVENGATSILEALAANPQLVLTDFGPDEYREDRLRSVAHDGTIAHRGQRRAAHRHRR